MPSRNGEVKIYKESETGFVRQDTVTEIARTCFFSGFTIGVLITVLIYKVVRYFYS